MKQGFSLLPLINYFPLPPSRRLIIVNITIIMIILIIISRNDHRRHKCSHPHQSFLVSSSDYIHHVINLFTSSGHRWGNNDVFLTLYNLYFRLLFYMFLSSVHLLWWIDSTCHWGKTKRLTWHAMVVYTLLTVLSWRFWGTLTTSTGCFPNRDHSTLRMEYSSSQRWREPCRHRRFCWVIKAEIMQDADDGGRW